MSGITGATQRMPFSVEILPRLKYALRWVAQHKIAIALGIVGIVAAYAVFGQAVDRQGQGAIKQPAIEGKRRTNPHFSIVYLPYWHESNDQDDLSIADITLTGNVPYELDLSTMCSPPDGYLGTGTITFSDVSGDYPTGVSRTDATVSGTPSEAGEFSKQIRCTLDGATTVDTTLDFVVVSPDNVAPSAPSIPSITVSTPETLTIESSLCSDASGIDYYTLYRSSTQGVDGSFIATVETPTWTFTPPSTTNRWWSFSCTDNAGNESDQGVQIQLPPPSGGGGGGGEVPADTLPTDGAINGRWTFETGSTSGATIVHGQGVNVVKNCDDCDLLVQSDVVRAGNNALKVRMAYVNSTDDYHNEIRLLDPRCNWFEDCWFAWSVCYPTDNYDTLDGRWEIHGQGHGASPGDEPNLNPVFTMGYLSDNRWVVNLRSNSTEPTIKAQTVHNSPSYTQPTRGEWHDIVVNIVYDYRSTGNVGRVDIWMDGTKIISREHAIGYNGPETPFYKFGLYKNSWKANAPTGSLPTERTIYYDSLRFDISGGSYATVAPPGERPDTCP